MNGPHIFKGWLQHQGNRPKTIQWKLKQLRTYLHWLAYNKSSPQVVTYSQLMDYIGSLQQENYSKTSINQHLRVASQYHRSLDLAFPAPGLRQRGVVKKVPEVLTAGQLEQLYANFQSPKGNGYYHHSDKLILGLIIYQGLELGDLFLLETGHLKLPEGKVYIPGRRSRESRTLILEAHQIMPLHHYLHEMRPYFEQHYSFNMKPKSLSCKLFIPQCDHLDRLVHQQKFLVKKVRAQTHKEGFKVKNLQQLRQTRLAIWVKEHGLRKAQYMAGFKSISGIERYKTQHLEDLQKQLENYHPLSGNHKDS